MSDDKQNNDDIANLSFEIALKQLQEIAEKLEKGDSPLQEAIGFYERGDLLKQRCEKLLKEAELKFEQVGETTSGDTVSGSTSSGNKLDGSPSDGA